MANPETDRLELVQVVNFKGGLFAGLFGLSKNISVADGFSIEVFRGERHLGSILSRDVAVVSDIKKSCESMGVRNDDTLFRVNLGAKLITLTGNLATPDGYEPGYKVVLELGVVNPRQFAMRYRQQDDPLRIAQAALEGEFRRYAMLRSHDRLRTDELRYRAEHTLNVGNNKDTGLDVMRVHDVTILMDQHLQKERDIIRTENLNRTKVVEGQKTQVIQSQFTRDEHKKDVAAEVDIQGVKRQQDYLDAMAQVYKEGMVTRIREQMDSGFTLDEIVAENPLLQGLYSFLPSVGAESYLGPGNRPELTSGRSAHPSNGEPVDGQAEADAASHQGTRRQKMETLNIANLGLLLMPATLTQVQQEAAGHSESEAFVVCAVTPGSLASNASLMVGDIVVSVNNETTSDAQILADTLRLRNRADQISMHVLRGGQLVSLKIEGTL